MKKKLVIVAVLLLLVAAAIFVTVFGRSQNKPTTQAVEQVAVDGVGIPEGKKPTSGFGTMKELLSLGSDLECQVIFERTDTEGDIEGTLFTSKGSLRGDFMVPAAEFGGKVLSSMIVGGQSMYVWSTINGAAFGFKTDLNNEKTKQMDTKEPVGLEAQIKYTCTDWTEVDGSVFVPPAEVSFKDLSSVIDAGMEYGTKSE